MEEITVQAVPEEETAAAETAEAAEEPEEAAEAPAEEKEDDGLLERISALEQQLAEQNEAHRAELAEEKLKAHFAALTYQAEELKRDFPDFDLMRELEDPEFLRLTSPEVGLSADQAFYALHYPELRKAAAGETAMAISNAIRSGSALPAENGTVRREAAAAPRLYSEMTPEERRLQKKLILSGARF